MSAPEVVYPHSGKCANCLRDRDDLFWHAQDRKFYCADVWACEYRYYLQGEREAREFAASLDSHQESKK